MFLPTIFEELPSSIEITIISESVRTSSQQEKNTDSLLRKAPEVLVPAMFRNLPSFILNFITLTLSLRQELFSSCSLPENALQLPLRFPVYNILKSIFLPSNVKHVPQRYSISPPKYTALININKTEDCTG